MLAVGGGVLWGACFSRHPGLWLPWVGLVPLVLLLGSPHRGRWTFVHGLIAWLVSISWLAHTLTVYGGLPQILSFFLLLLLVAYLALFSCLFGLVGGVLWRGGGMLAFVGLPALWVTLEWVRAHLWSGFPWNLAAYSWVAVPGALPTSSFVGAYGVSFLVVLVATSVADSLRRRRWEPGTAGILLVLLVLSTGARFGDRTEAGQSATPYRIVQPNTQNLVQWDAQQVFDSYDRLLRMSEAACDEPGALVIWPESAAWPWAWQRDPHLVRDVLNLSTRCRVLLNSPRWDAPDQEEQPTFNSVLLVEHGQVVGRYDKRHLVPWGEYVPLRELLPFVGYLARNAGEFAAGREPSLLPLGDDRIGTAICFEIIFPAEVAQEVRAGASLLVTVTNDAWYGDTFAPWQHLRAAQFRAAENGRPVLRAAITGISASIDARGELLQTLAVGEEGILRGQVQGRHGLTPFSRASWIVPLACLLLTAASWWVARRRSRSAERA